MPEYDYCITGAGCAGLSLLVRLLAVPSFQQKKILLIERDDKSANDRTWCFWEKGEGFFEQIVFQRWSTLWFHGRERSRRMETAPFVYKMIRGIDFYNFCFDRILGFDNVTVRSGRVERVGADGGDAFAVVDGRTITAGRIFNSIPFGGAPASPRDWRLLQHFKGWMIRSLETVFDAGEATIMDFRTSQDAGACFFYVLPVGADRALVECTYFSKEELPEAEYDRLLVGYISGVLKIRDFVILESENGVIPMTTASRPKEEGAVFHIGAAAGLTKPSSGYTWQFIQEDSASIVASLVQDGIPARPVVSGRFRWYDRILLNVLATGKLTGEEVFSALFSGAGLADVFAFLDNASTLWQDLKIMGSLPKGPFVRAAVGEVMGWRK